VNIPVTASRMTPNGSGRNRDECGPVRFYPEVHSGP
jgi:hypothetical protein